jgi:hypothetical protein
VDDANNQSSYPYRTLYCSKDPGSYNISGVSNTGEITFSRPIQYFSTMKGISIFNCTLVLVVLPKNERSFLDIERRKSAAAGMDVPEILSAPLIVKAPTVFGNVEKSYQRLLKLIPVHLIHFLGPNLQ